MRAFSRGVALVGVVALAFPVAARGQSDETAYVARKNAEAAAAAAREDRKKKAEKNREIIRQTLKPESPCKGEVIAPDSRGFFNFDFHSGVVGSFYDIEFGKTEAAANFVEEGLANDRLNPIGVYPLLFNADTWYWRVRAGGFASASCRFKIVPADGKQVLPPPELLAPPCGATFHGGVLKLDATSSGSFKVYGVQTEVWNGGEGRWREQPLISYLDKGQESMRYGFFIPVSHLPGKKWRWRARLATEKMPPIFANQTEGEWSDWCKFDVP